MPCWCANSIASATVYMTWMAIYYTNITTMRSELEREAERHRATAARLRRAADGSAAGRSVGGDLAGRDVGHLLRGTR